MVRRNGLLLGSCAIAGLIAPLEAAADTITYSYDAKGRLRTSSVSGGPNNGTNTAICYDAADNRRQYVTVVGGAAACVSTPAPTPTPTPTPTNQPPVAGTDWTQVQMCGSGQQIAVLDNDSDPDGNTPLTVVSVSGASLGAAFVVGGLRISYQPHGFPSGTDSFTYQVRDSLGATATGTVHVEVMDVGC